MTNHSAAIRHWIERWPHGPIPDLSLAHVDASGYGPSPRNSWRLESCPLDQWINYWLFVACALDGLAGKGEA